MLCSILFIDMVTIQDRHPELLEDGNFPKDIGASIGIELRDKNNLLNQGSLGKAKPGMAFSVTIGMCIHVYILYHISYESMDIVYFTVGEYQMIVSCRRSKKSYR